MSAAPRPPTPDDRLGGSLDPPPYLSIAQLARFVPWSPPAIRRMVSRGQLRVGRHYFQPSGPGGQLVFSWRGIVEYIEASGPVRTEADRAAVGLAVDVDAIKEEAKALLG